MKYMLDTNICIFIIKHKPQTVIDKFLKLKSNDICISSITFAELSYGVEKSLSNIEIKPFDSQAAEEYGVVRSELERAGLPIGSLDTQIAAHARSLGLTLVTNNTREFKRVSKLSVEDWTTSSTTTSNTAWEMN